MNKRDGRSLSEEALEVLRRQAHRLRQEGSTWTEIASTTGVHLSTVMSWSRRFNLGSAEAGEVASARRGRRFGDKRTLELVDEVGLRELIVSGPPSALGLPYALWSRRAVQEAVKAKFALDMPIRTVGEYLRRWGFTPQRPAKRALEQRPEQVRRWLQEDYPAIVRQARAEAAEICWADETALRQDTAWVRGYAPAGHTPVIEHAARWQSLTLISALTNQGLVRFACHDGAINAVRFIDFMQALVDDAGAKVLLIVDNLRVHHAKTVQAWLASRKQHIEVFYLPPYTPQANPDELLNRDLKTELRSRPAAPSAEALKRMALGFMATLATMPERVIGYFSNPHVAYAGGHGG
jgi:transposase